MSDSTPAARLLERLDRVRPVGEGKHQARCPAHEDRNPSLSITEKDDGDVLVHCHANCALDDVLAAVDLTRRDLFGQRNGERELVAAYDYVDAEGERLFQVVRFAPKDFRQRRRNGADGWTWNLNGTKRVLYRLPRVLAAVERGEAVFVVEGEKDVHALEQRGMVATCNAGGAGKWRDDYSTCLKGAEVIVVADRDKPGRKHALAVAKSLQGVAGEVNVVEPTLGKDMAEHLAKGGRLLQVQELAATPTEEAAQLQTLAQQARVAHREADLQSRAQADSVERIRGQIVQAHAEGADRAVASLTEELASQRLEAEQAVLKADGLARRVANTDQAVKAFTAQHCDELVQELTPEAEAIRDRLMDGVEQVVRADREWGAMSQRVGAILRHAPNASPASDLSSEHALSSAVRDLRHALGAAGSVEAPVPHWSGRFDAEDNQRRTKLSKLQSKSNPTDAEVHDRPDSSPSSVQGGSHAQALRRVRRTQQVLTLPVAPAPQRVNPPMAQHAYPGAATRPLPLPLLRRICQHRRPQAPGGSRRNRPPEQPRRRLRDVQQGKGGDVNHNHRSTADTPRSPISLPDVVRCPRCGELKARDGFYPDRSKASGFKSLCKECDKAKARRYYEQSKGTT